MRRAAIISIVLAAAFSCTRPPSIEPFIIRENSEYGDTYSFNLDMADSTVEYSLAFYTRMTRQAFGAYSADSLDLGVRWISPSDSSWLDNVVLRLDDPIDSSYFSRDFVFPFMDPVSVFERGEWRLRVQVRNNPQGLRGLGIIFKRKENGTRQASQVR